MQNCQIKEVIKHLLITLYIQITIQDDLHNRKTKYTQLIASSITDGSSY